MLQLEAKSLDGLNGYSLSYQKKFALQALAGVNRSGVYDEHTKEYLSRLLNIDAYDFETTYSNYTPEQIAYLIDRNQDGIAGTGFGVSGRMAGERFSLDSLFYSLVGYLRT